MSSRRSPLAAAALAVASAAAVAGSIAASGCGSARRGLPVAEPVHLTDPALVQGRRVFMAHCHQCHPGGAAGLAPSINDKPLPGWLMRWQVRHGLGAMPAFSESVMDDADLDRLIAYLNHLQSLDPPAPDGVAATERPR